METPAILRAIGWAFEDYPRETIGIAYGEQHQGRHGRRVLVSNVDGIQANLKTPLKTDWDITKVRRFETIVGESIGSFHSHTYLRKRNGEAEYGQVYMGNVDKKDLDEYLDKIEIIVALNPAQRWSPLTVGDFLASGCFEYRGRLYRFQMGVYYIEPTNNGNGRVRRSRISVPMRELRNYFL
jgi:hypothetical protein